MPVVIPCIERRCENRTTLLTNGFFWRAPSRCLPTSGSIQNTMFGNKTTVEVGDFQAPALAANMATCVFTTGKLTCTLNAGVLSKLATGTNTLNQFRLYLPYSTYTNGNAQADFITIKPGAKVTLTYTNPSASPTPAKTPAAAAASHVRDKRELASSSTVDSEVAVVV